MRALQQFVGQYAPRVNVGAVIGVAVTGGLLGRHVRRRANGHAGLCERGAIAVVRLRTGCIERFGNAKVGHHGGATREQHVVRLDVTMHDATCMGVGERLGHVAQNTQRFGRGDCTARKPYSQ